MLLTFNLSLFIRKLSLFRSFPSSILSSLNLSLLIINKKQNVYIYISPFLLFPLLLFSLSLSLSLSLSSNDVCNSSLLPPPLVVAYSLRKEYDISSLSLFAAYISIFYKHVLTICNIHSLTVFRVYGVFDFKLNSEKNQLHFYGK